MIGNRNFLRSLDSSFTPSFPSFRFFNGLRRRAGLLAPQEVGWLDCYWSGGCGRIGLPDVGRQRDTDSLERATDIACHRCAQNEALAVLFSFDFLNAIEVHEQGAPLGFQSRRGEMVFQPLAQHECEERAKYVAADGGVLLMINRPGVENRFCRSEDVLDLEQLSIAQHDGERA